ncbi:MAG: protein phosphatase 2C domain-containing protein [Betaproteobacteria bacterium]|nr:protein phosphatase 2C domain-containing protein [Betaproteobacteria bacterium]MCL2886323.1 protein phosphatase 2C domain-containing protein [Betaproteobacteria bacterium]
MTLSIDACVAQHQGDRTEQQDRVAILPHPRRPGIVLVVVADGMGGHTGGALAAEQVIHSARNNLEHFAPSEESPRLLLQNSMLEAHTMIKASRFINEKDPHSTGVLMLLQPGKAAWGHCGDSRFYHFRDHRLVHRSVDHSYVEHLLATGHITPEQALTHPNRNVLLTSLGGRDDPQFDFAEAADLVAGDAFLLCSDGLWAYFSDAELADLIAENSARRACELLIAAARQRADGDGDNLSLAIVKLVEAPVAKAKPPAPTGAMSRPYG